jgi:hypothetical protein
VLRARRRIATQPSGWALSLDGVRSLLGQAWPEGLPGAQALPDGDGGAIETNGRASEVKSDRAGEEAAAIDQQDPLAAEIAAINAVLVRSEAVITDIRSASRRRARKGSAGLRSRLGRGRAARRVAARRGGNRGHAAGAAGNRPPGCLECA